MVDKFEFRLGNIVRLYTDDSNFTEFPLDLPDFILLVQNQQKNGVYAPAPLTERVLLDCGFETGGDGEFIHPLFGWFVLKYEQRFNGYKLVVLPSTKQSPLQYLHQLQNLFYGLTHTEIVYSPTSTQ